MRFKVKTIQVDLDGEELYTIACSICSGLQRSIDTDILNLEDNYEEDIEVYTKTFIERHRMQINLMNKFFAPATPATSSSHFLQDVVIRYLKSEYEKRKNLKV